LWQIGDNGFIEQSDIAKKMFEVLLSKCQAILLCCFYRFDLSPVLIVLHLIDNIEESIRLLDDFGIVDLLRIVSVVEFADFDHDLEKEGVQIEEHVVLLEVETEAGEALADLLLVLEEVGDEGEEAADVLENDLDLGFEGADAQNGQIFYHRLIVVQGIQLSIEVDES
jgi:hypothetical protein